MSPKLEQSLVVANKSIEESIDPFDRYMAATRLARLLQRFPTTLMVLGPYMLLIIPMAIVFRNPSLPFILGVMGLALLGTFLVEFCVSVKDKEHRLSRSRTSLRSYGRALVWTAGASSVIGAVSRTASASLGAGTVEAQVNVRAVRSSLASVLSLFSSWAYVGPALMIAAYLAGSVSRKTIGIWFVSLFLLEIVRTTFTAITAPLISYLIFLIVLSLYAALIGLKQCVIITTLVLILWPMAFTVRNEIRTDAGVAVSARVDAFDRLRYDLQIARAEKLKPGLDLGQPGINEVLRYGLVPRIFDSKRAITSTGSLINVYLGGVRTSSYTFLPVTTLYVLEGAWMTVIFYACIAFLLTIILRRGYELSPSRMVLFALVLYGPLNWFATYPDSTTLALQGLVASLPLLFVIRAGRRQLFSRISPKLDEVVR